MVECEGFHKYSIEELREIINTATKELLKKEWEDIAKEVISRDLVNKEKLSNDEECYVNWIHDRIIDR